VNVLFTTLLACCCLYAFVAGGGPERIGAVVYAIACTLTVIAASAAPIRYQSVEVGVLIVDVLLFAAFSCVAVKANRFWPIWVSALLGLGVLGHLARWAGPDVIPWAYAAVLTIWSYPILAIIALGTFNHQRRLKRFGVDRSWSSSSVRSEPPAGPTG
jgi:hypothetical protein